MAQSFLCLLEVVVAQFCELVVSKFLLFVQLVHIVGLGCVFVVFWRLNWRSLRWCLSFQLKHGFGTILVSESAFVSNIFCSWLHYAI